MSEVRLVLVDRDKKIIREIDRWRVCQGKHIRELAGFDGQRACDRRLRKLMDAGYIKREKILYGVAGLYRNTAMASRIVNIPNVNRKIRIDQIMHDIAVLDTVIYFNKKHGISFEDITSEIELHRFDGFGVRKHRPDFIFKQDGKTICVEIELSLKSKERFETHIKNNFQGYDRQIWVVPCLNSKIARVLEKSKTEYPNIEVLGLREIQEMENDKQWITF